MNGEFLVERCSEFLREVDEQVEDVVLFVGQEKAFLQITGAAMEARCCLVVVLWDLEQLLKEHDDEFDHLLVLLRQLIFL